MKGIILAGGTGSRLQPLTTTSSKQLLPVYDKPMIYYPLSTLIDMGIQEILIITTPQHQSQFQALLGDGNQWGIELSYLTQANANGIAEAFILAETFIGDENVCLILGDNLFFGSAMTQTLKRAQQKLTGGVIFGYEVADPRRYGVVTFNEQHQVIDITEKPASPKSNYAIPGVYFYTPDVVAFARSLSPSDRGELEITDIHQCYLDQQRLHVALIEPGVAWLDAGTHDALLEATNYVAIIQRRQGIRLGCPQTAAQRQLSDSI